MAVTKLIQVTNISPAISEEQMLTLFGFVGKIEAMCMYPSLQDLESTPNTPKICYIKFFDAACVGVSQYLTNTVFIDRALVVTPVEDGQIPDEEKAKEMAAQVGSPPAANKPPDKPKSEIINLLEGTPPNQLVVSHDPRLEQLGLPKYPPLPASFEGPVIEEIRRTVLIIDINKEVTSEELMQCFEKAGDVKYMKFCSRSDDIRYALIEFTEQTHVIEALKMNGLKFRGKKMKVYHSTQAITKPETKSNEVAQREVVEALTRLKEAESLISAAVDPLLSLSKSKKGRSRSKSPRRSRRSRSRRRSRSHSHSRRRRASSRTRRSRSGSHQRKLKPKSPRRHRKSRSRSPRTSKKSRSKSPRTKRKSRSKSPSRPKRKSRSKSPARAKKRSRTKSPPKSKGSRSLKRSRSRSRPKHRPSPKSKTASSKSALSRDKSKPADSKSHDKKARDTRSAKKEKGEPRRREKDHRRSKHDHKSGKENGSHFSHTDRASTDTSFSDKGNLVKENGELELCKDGLRIPADHGSGIASTFNQTDEYNKKMEYQGEAGKLDICTSENSSSVLKGPDNDFKSEELKGTEDQNFSSNLQCDSSTVDSSLVKCCNENQYPVEVLESSRYNSHSPSDSPSGHCLPNLADCDTRSCSPVELQNIECDT